MDADPRREAATTPTIERRKSPRHRIEAPTAGSLVASDAGARLLDVSDGGFALETAHPFERGHTVEFHITVGVYAGMTLRGRVVHVMRTATDDGIRYVVGVQVS